VAGCQHGYVNLCNLVVPCLQVLILGCHLHSKLKEALPASMKHRALLNALSATFPPQTVAKWTKMVDDWQEDISALNRFREMTLGKESVQFLIMMCLTRSAETTQEDVEHKLLAEEVAEADTQSNEDSLVHTTTASMFLSMGLDLEDQQ
jgi:hypothetical protein